VGRAGQATQLQPQNRPPMGSADLGQPALKAQARGDTLAALAWIRLHPAPPRGGPPPSDGALAQGSLPGGGRAVLPPVLRRGLADLPERLAA
jgi:hypothetical protein